MYTQGLEGEYTKGTKGNVIPIRMDCHDFSMWFGDIKFLHIDACHDYKSVITTIRNLLPYMIEGGIMCGDDFEMGTYG